MNYKEYQTITAELIDVAKLVACLKGENAQLKERVAFLESLVIKLSPQQSQSINIDTLPQHNQHGETK